MRSVACALVLACVAGAALAQDTPGAAVARTKDDFAQGLSLSVQPGLSVQTLLLPLEVYRGTRAAHDDLSVFNAKGEPVPFALRSLRRETRLSEEEHTVPVFPIKERAANAEPGALQLRVRRDADGTIVDIASTGPEAGASGRAGAEEAANSALVAYVIDASKLEQAPLRLRLELELGSESFTTRVQVEGSDDLSGWSPRGVGTIGQLQHAGESIQRTQIELAPTRAKYLRLRWQGTLPVLRAAKLSVRREQSEREPALVSITLPARRAVEHEYRADLGGVLPLVSVSARLPANTLIVASVSARTSLAETVDPIFQGQLFRLEHAGQELVSPAIELGVRWARFVSLELDPRTDALFEQLPLELTYAPQQLLFLTRGEGPYLLAFGSYKQTPAPFDAERLLAFMPEAARAALPRESAQVSGRQRLAGPTAREAPLPPRSYRKHVLWAVLIVSAGLLVALALRLLRRLGT